MLLSRFSSNLNPVGDNNSGGLGAVKGCSSKNPGSPHGRQLETIPTPPGNLGFWATTEPAFPEFFNNTLFRIFSYLPPHVFL